MASFSQRAAKGRKKPHGSQIWNKLSKYFYNPSEIVNLIQDVLFNNNKISLVMYLLLPLEIFLNFLIVFKIKCNFYSNF